jgi:hypothetical protein
MISRQDFTDRSANWKSIMADKNDDTFLGGGIKFNSAGAGAPPSEPVTEITPQGMQPHQIRAAIIISVVVVMVIALFTISIGLTDRDAGGRHRVLAPKPKPEPGEKAF